MKVTDATEMAGPVLSKQWRKKKGLDQGSAAGAIGVGQSTLSDWEAGKKEPSLTYAFRYEDETGGEVPARAWTETIRQHRARARRGERVETASS